MMGRVDSDANGMEVADLATPKRRPAATLATSVHDRAVVGVPRLAIAHRLEAMRWMALTRNSEIDAVPNARSDAAGAGELAVRGTMPVSRR